MDILLISNEDTCRSRIAQELLHAFGRGMNISTAGIMEGNCVPDAVCNVMEQNGFSVSSCCLVVRAVQTPIAVVNSEICVFFEAIS